MGLDALRDNKLHDLLHNLFIAFRFMPFRFILHDCNTSFAIFTFPKKNTVKVEIIIKSYIACFTFYDHVTNFILFYR